jgi:hypothetical protein
MEVIERTKGHYDVQEVQFGTVYKWCPERVVVERLRPDDNCYPLGERLSQVRR